MGTPIFNSGSLAGKSREEKEQIYKQREGAPDSPSLNAHYGEPKYRWAEVYYVMGFVWPHRQLSDYYEELYNGGKSRPASQILTSCDAGASGNVVADGRMDASSEEGAVAAP